MPINSESLNRKLYDLLTVRGYNPKPLDVEGKVTPVPEESAVMKFDFVKDDKNYGKVWISIDGSKTLQVYYGDAVADSPSDKTSDSSYDDTWTGLIRHLKNWAQRRQLGFELKNENHLESDMAKRSHTAKKEKISEASTAGKSNSSFIITAKTAEGDTKKYRVKAQSPNMAKEKFSQHHSMAKILNVSEEGMSEGSYKTYQPKHVAWVVQHGDGKVSEFKPHEDDAAKAQFEKVKGNRGASIYAIDQHSQSIPIGSLKAMRKKQDMAEGYWQDAVKKAEADREARKGKPFEKNPASHDEKGIYKGDKDLAGNPVPKRKEEGVAEGWEGDTLSTGPDGKLTAKGEEQMQRYRQQKREQEKQRIIAKHSSTVKGQPYGVAPSRISQSRYEVDWKAANKELRKKGLDEQGVAEGNQQVNEGYYPMGKQGSYSDAVPTTKIIIQHSRKIEEGEQRYRNIAKIFVENSDGERFAVPTNKPSLARVYARHIAEGGTPYDERGKHITSLVEEYSKMAGFVRATKGKQFNESAQQLVNEGLTHYQSLRESLSKMTGKRGYEAYFESWTPPLMEDEAEETNLNELFVQETLDPRIESVMPILSKLQKNLGEMKEVNALAEWADSLLEGGDGGEASEEEDGDTAGDAGEGGAEDAPADELTEAPGAETLAHNDRTEAGNLKAFDLDEEESLTSNNPVGIPEEEDGTPHSHQAQTTLKHLKKSSYGDRADAANIKPGIAGFRDRIAMLQRAKDEGNLKDELDEDEFAGEYATGEAGQWRNKGPKAHKPATIGDLVGENFINTDAQAVVSEMDKSDDVKGPEGKAKPITPKKMADDAKKVLDKKKVKEGQEDLDTIKRLLGK